MLRALIIAIISAACLAQPARAADAFAANAFPAKVPQGDPFAIRVTGAGMGPVTGEAMGRILYFTRCGEGCFMAIGLADADQEPGTQWASLRVGRDRASVRLDVVAVDFGHQELTLPRDKVELSPEDEKRADLEAIRLRAIWGQATERLWDGDFIMPLGNSYSTGFGVLRIMNGIKKSRHSGLDIRGAQGEPVLAANNGHVVFAEETFFGGNTVVLDHGLGIYTVYMHMSGFKVRPGEVVMKGDTVGLVGSTGRSTGPHLHYTLKINALNANPESITHLPLARLLTGR